MITANKGCAKVAGTTLDIIYEFNNIIYSLSYRPEIVLGVISAWSSILEEKMKDVSPFELTAISHMSEDYIKTMRESEGDND